MLTLGVGVAFLARHPVVPAMRRATIFCLFYAAALVLAFQLWPDFRLQWSAGTLSGYGLGLMPAEKLAWAFVAGSTYPLVFAFVTGTDTDAIAHAALPRVISR